jgi:hypothetical protein
MEGLSRHCVRTDGGVHDWATEQVEAHSLGRVDTSFVRLRTRTGERVDRLHH